MNASTVFPPHRVTIVGALNVTPPNLTAHFNFRYSTEWNHASLSESVGQTLEKHGLDYELEWQLQGEPFLTRGGPLVDAVVQAIIDICGAPPARSTAGGTSDGRYIAPAGAEVIELGPVNASIHKVDEHVRVADVQRLVDIYARILELLLAAKRD